MITKVDRQTEINRREQKHWPSEKAKEREKVTKADRKTEIKLKRIETLASRKGKRGRRGDKGGQKDRNEKQRQKVKNAAFFVVDRIFFIFLTYSCSLAQTYIFFWSKLFFCRNIFFFCCCASHHICYSYLDHFYVCSPLSALNGLLTRCEW